MVDSYVSHILPLGIFAAIFAAVAPNLFSTSYVDMASSLLLLLHAFAVLPTLLHLATRSKEERGAAMSSFLGRMWRTAAVATATGNPVASLPLVVVYLEQDGLIDQVSQADARFFS